MIFSVAVLMAAASCRQSGEGVDITTQNAPDTTDILGPQWAVSANIYEVNVRQYSPEGSFAAFANHLPRLQRMGVDILWFMPIYPISETRRKGPLGSYYAISDYTAINPNFGTMEEFKELVQRIHDMDMRVILDWVPNHTGWDHHWIEEHPEWYTKDQNGEITDPINPETGESWGWTDVADLNYDKQEMRRAMIGEMKFWLEKVEVDGFRCDVAGAVPLDFWEQAVPELKTVRDDIFMLAEAEVPEHRNRGLFNMSYGWSFHHLMNHLAQQDSTANAIDRWLKQDNRKFRQGYHMQFITNHDENSWNGAVEERLGPAADAMAVLAFTLDGMPLIYSGQEAGLNKRLKFFEKDQIEWGDVPKENFYTTLLRLKHENRALWNGAAGGEPVRLKTGNPRDVYAFVREKEGHKVIVVLNLSDDLQEVRLKGDRINGEYTNIFANSTTTVTDNMMMELSPWGYVVLSNR